MSTKLPFRVFSVGVTALVLLVTVSAHAGTIAIPIDLTDQQAELGHYLAGDFDFGMAFSHVETMTLEFRLADGYASVAVGTGSSLYFRWLAAMVDEPGKQFVIDPMSFTWPSPANATGLGKTIGNVPPETLYQTVFGPTISWPGVLNGRGRVALIDISLTSFSSLNFGDRPPEASWLSLTGIDAVRLIVDGTPVPEPSVLLVISIVPILGMWHVRVR